MKNLKTKLERARRADYHFAVASVALMVFMVVAGFGAWMYRRIAIRRLATVSTRISSTQVQNFGSSPSGRQRGMAKERLIYTPRIVGDEGHECRRT